MNPADHGAGDPGGSGIGALNGTSAFPTESWREAPRGSVQVTLPPDALPSTAIESDPGTPPAQRRRGHRAADPEDAVADTVAAGGEDRPSGVTPTVDPDATAGGSPQPSVAQSWPAAPVADQDFRWDEQRRQAEPQLAEGAQAEGPGTEVEPDASAEHEPTPIQRQAQPPLTQQPQPEQPPSQQPPIPPQPQFFAPGQAPVPPPPMSQRPPSAQQPYVQPGQQPPPGQFPAAGPYPPGPPPAGHPAPQPEQPGQYPRAPYPPGQYAPPPPPPPPSVQPQPGQQQRPREDRWPQQTPPSRPQQTRPPEPPPFVWTDAYQTGAQGVREQPAARSWPPAAQSSAPQLSPYQLAGQPSPEPGPPPTRGSETLGAESLITSRRGRNSGGWRKAVSNMSVRPGHAKAEQRRRELIAQATVPVRGCYRIAVISLKGGVGKTTSTVCIGATLASLRGDRVIAVDANPDRGTLSGKIPLQTTATVRNLLNDVDRIQTYSDIRRYTSQSPDRLEVLASESDPSVSLAFGEEDYRRVASVLERFYNVVLTDCGTGLLHSAMSGVLALADQIVVVSSGSVDGARSASATLDWLEAHGYSQLVAGGLAVINSVRPKSGGVNIDALESHFASRCRSVTRIPYDPHLELGAEVDLAELQQSTRDALLELAAHVAAGFPGQPQPGYPGQPAPMPPGAVPPPNVMGQPDWSAQDGQPPADG